MTSFVIHLQSPTQSQQIEDVASFVGQDESGSFGIQAGHERMMTILSYGLARYRTREEKWIYLALPGAVVYFVGNGLYITTRHYYLDTDYQRISNALLKELMDEEELLHTVKESITRLEQEMLRRMWQMQRVAS
ncbi:F0F1 ATP synthase subunit epsilon [Sulfurirhabdus autotrophica]|uniref:F-type H+-transporting ATPase subunit epsilon n=1 Tax=Sulfurirhabdus autotrophica TaxID=1706046 RepID=A0A4R3YGC0_9PROT|nr:F0F1 ATP synthase subunit epsilon [Sulfurirhabdus autotrophica]TCV90268.1 F-type H+-transporting ATPase subunit epsilon [Sulfurirhabdus autotrophica]